jgi:hypothetical protein
MDAMFSGLSSAMARKPVQHEMYDQIPVGELMNTQCAEPDAALGGDLCVEMANDGLCSF